MTEHLLDRRRLEEVCAVLERRCEAAFHLGHDEGQINLGHALFECKRLNLEPAEIHSCAFFRERKRSESVVLLMCFLQYEHRLKEWRIDRRSNGLQTLNQQRERIILIRECIEHGPAHTLHEL